jgi:hypothetical protein
MLPPDQGFRVQVDLLKYIYSILLPVWYWKYMLEI